MPTMATRKQCREKSYSERQETGSYHYGIYNHRFDRLEQQNLELRSGMKNIHEDLAILKAKADAILRQTFELTEFTENNV